MRRNILTVATGSFMALGAASLAAQETPSAEVSTESKAVTTAPTAEDGEEPETR